MRLLVLVGLLLVDLAVGSLLLDDGTPADRRLENSPAAGYDQARVAAIQRDSDGTRFVLVDGLWRLAPVSSTFVNVDGVRRTIGNREGGARVAFGGGSAAFGVGQADDSTIPSVLAGLLNEGDLPVHVENLGTPAWTSYDVAQDLGARLAAGERFDVVVVYAGVNELALSMLGGRVPTTIVGVFDAASGRASSGFVDRWADRSMVARLAGRAPRRAATPIRLSEAWGRPVSATPANGVGDEEASPAMAGSRMVVDAVFNYVEGDRVLRELAAEYGFTLLQVVQPARPSGRSPLYQYVVGEYGREVEGVVDLSDLLPDRCFFDTVHTIEPCSPLVAEALRDELAPVLAGLSSARPVSAG